MSIPNYITCSVVLLFSLSRTSFFLIFLCPFSSTGLYSPGEIAIMDNKNARVIRAIHTEATIIRKELHHNNQNNERNDNNMNGNNHNGHSNNGNNNSSNYNGYGNNNSMNCNVNYGNNGNNVNTGTVVLCVNSLSMFVTLSL